MAEGQETRVVVNSYGVLGKRVAAAVMRQDDMSLVGVSDVVTDWRARIVTRNASTRRAAHSLGAHAIVMRGCKPETA